MKSDIFNNQYNKINFKYRVKKGFTSVIIPVYKDVLGLKDTLDSLKKQTIPQYNFEIIIANDGADKAITKLCKEYSVCEVKIKPNKGSYNARNKALESSRGEFIAFTDADVIVENKWIESGTKGLFNYDYVGGPVEFIHKDNYSVVDKYLMEYEFNSIHLFNTSHYCVTANVFTKRVLIQKVGAFDYRLKSGGDNEFGNRIYFSNKFKINYDKKLIVFHRFRNYKEILIKKKRIFRGLNDLMNYYPDRYSMLFDSSYFDMFLNLLKPPKEKNESLSLLLFVWWQSILDYYFIFKYINKRKLFHEKSKIYKYKKMIFNY